MHTLTSMLRLLLLVSLISSHKTEQLLVQSPCFSMTTCSDCIRTASCAWCFAASFNGPRCFNPTMKGGTAGCDEAWIFNPDNGRSIDPMYNRELSRARSKTTSTSAGSSEAGSEFSAGDDNHVQIKPQKVTLNLRKNVMQELKFSFSQAEDYPVDLYYLMDLSYSMKDDKEKLSTLGALLSSTMKNITSNFRIGFGSFVDKTVVPYILTSLENFHSICKDCTVPYGFKNHMSLSDDTKFFEKAVAKAEVSANNDAPEGGFDAIMQAIVCKQHIGWRQQARRLLVFSTDAGFHYAGDGKLGGIVEPNDGECHMENNEYTHSLLQDYPSISHINLKAREHSINIIFAVIANKFNVYDDLSRNIEGSSCGVLSENSNNVVDLVREQYNKITSAVEIKDTFNDDLGVSYFSSCLNHTDDTEQTNRCEGIRENYLLLTGVLVLGCIASDGLSLRRLTAVGDVVDFTAKITLRKCPKDPNQWKQTFRIYPVGISESLSVEVNMICDCPCEHPGNNAYNGSLDVCSGQGVSACGVCICNPGSFGKKCECSALAESSIEQKDGCRPAHVTSGPLCSNRGTCSCGFCQCNVMDDPYKVISGPFCECDNFTCDMNKGQICSGPDHGDCVCGKCVCRPQYSGPACQCLEDTTPCKGPDGNICSGNGKCVCGQCVCDVDAVTKERHYYTGKFCQNCLTCEGRCDVYTPCVECKAYKRGVLFDEFTGLCADNCTLDVTIEEGKVEVNESANERLCSFYNEQDCLHIYVYPYDEEQNVHVRLQKEPVCPKKVFILGVVLGVIAAIVLVGLTLLVLWKVATTIADRREYARFEKERMRAKWDAGGNPIYKQATSTFVNPTFEESQTTSR